MKAVKVSMLVICLSMMLFLPRADASFLSVSPTGSFDAVAMGVNSITFDVFFNIVDGEKYTFQSWDIHFMYDASELAFDSAIMLRSGIEELSGSELRNWWLNLDSTLDVTFMGEGPHLLGSLTFNILDPVQVFDGQADFEIIGQMGDLLQGFGTTAGTIIQYCEVDGADVGTVPIPGAVWLLGSGLVGLIGMGRRKMKRGARA